MDQSPSLARARLGDTAESASTRELRRGGGHGALAALDQSRSLARARLRDTAETA